MSRKMAWTLAWTKGRGNEAPTSILGRARPRPVLASWRCCSAGQPSPAKARLSLPGAPLSLQH